MHAYTIYTYICIYIYLICDRSWRRATLGSVFCCGLGGLFTYIHVYIYIPQTVCDGKVSGGLHGVLMLYRFDTWILPRKTSQWLERKQQSLQERCSACKTEVPPSHHCSHSNNYLATVHWCNDVFILL